MDISEENECPIIERDLRVDLEERPQSQPQIPDEVAPSGTHKTDCEVLFADAAFFGR